jgi:sigma-E factor negative regulatory protein RseB
MKRYNLNLLATRRLLIAAIVGACSVSSVVADSEGEELLNSMNRAFAEDSYDGVFSYFSGHDLASLRVVHKIVDGVQRERLVHLNGAPREIVRHGDEVACIVMPGDDLLALEESIPSGPFARAFVRSFDEVSHSYLVERSGEGRVAGRSAIRLAVSPKDEHRFGYRLWLDNESHLLLRSELIGHDGQPLEMFQFNTILIGDEVSDAALEASETQGSKVSHLRLEPSSATGLSTPSEPTSPMQWSVDWLPSGFSMATADIRRKIASEDPVSMFMYSDGLASFSIFVENMPTNGAAEMVSQHGATIALSHAVESQGSHYLVTLIGEIPLATARKIIDTVRHKG